VVGVYRGCEHQTNYELRGGPDSDAHLVAVGEQTNFRGSVEALVPPGDIHRVANAGDSFAVSLHVYGTDLRATGCSIRRRYDLPIR
jgi:predicted metal-dependent enzyme (double-stranded beta helix superfamily)